MSDSTQKETRFAVVMYGGVSLAIYINGIAQELYRMVAATADPSSAPATNAGWGSEHVYRKIGDKLKTRFVVDILSGTSAGGINGIFLAKALANGQSIKSLEQMWLDEGNIEVLINDRDSKDSDCQVDVAYPKSLLNSERMYNHLLKAFNDMDEPSSGNAPQRSALVDELDLYVTATDLQGFPVPLKLADIIALEKKHQNTFHFQFKKNEARDCGDFVQANNPFLAFAARCTSAFPFAFEPMRLQDITTDIEHKQWQRFYQKYLLDPAHCDKRHPHKHDKIDKKYDLFTKRAFADGGYLDNKPFSYAINAITSRGSKLPVDRKLIYIEPSPEEPPPICAVDDPPNAIENIGKAFSLALYETIQQDLQRIIDRNRLIERVKRILKGTTDDILEKKKADDILEKKKAPLTVGPWYEADLQHMIREEGIAYGGYLRLRVAQLTDDLTEMIARHAGFDVQSDFFLALRYIVRAWRDDLYEYYKKDTAQPGKNFNQFLYEYDLGFMIRRLSYTISIIDSIFPLVDLLKDKEDGGALSEEDEKKIRAEYGDFFFEVVEPIKSLKDLDAFRKRLQIIRAEISKRREAIYDLQAKLLKPDGKNGLTKAFRGIGIGPEEMIQKILGDRSESESYQAARSESESYQAAREFIIGPEEMIKKIFGDPSKSESYQAAREFIQPSDRKAPFTNIAEMIRQVVREADKHASLCKVELRLGKITKDGKEDTVDNVYAKKLDALLKKGNSDELDRYKINPFSIPDTVAEELKELEVLTDSKERAARLATWFAATFFRRFLRYDEIAYPIIQFSGVGQELDEVEIIRISPTDADSLSKHGVRKLGGTALMHFGAFLDRTWRKNDMLWGRLDGAERIIKAVLSGTPEEKEITSLVKEAHMAIIRETFFEQATDGSNANGPLRLQETIDLLVQLVLGKNNQDKKNNRNKIKSGQNKDADETLKSILTQILDGKLDEEKIYKWLEGYEVSRDVNPQLALESITRSTQVIGKMLGVMSEQYQPLKRPAAWLTRLGAFAWGVVEAAVPNSLPDLITRRLTSLVTLIAVIMIAGGFFLDESTLERFGILLLLSAAGFALIKFYLRGFLLKKKTRLNWLKRGIVFIIAAAIVGLAGIGIYYLPHVWDVLLKWFKC